MISRILIPGFLVLASAGGLWAQETPQSRARVALTPEAFRGIEALASAIELEGLPADPLYNKALEGVAKRVPQERLLPAVTAYAGRLRAAHGAFGPTSTTPLLVAGADAIQRGVGIEALRDLGRNEGRSPMAVLVLADLLETGVPTDRALEVLDEAMHQRAHGDAMLGIPGRVRMLMRQGHSPHEAAEQVRRGMQRGRGGGGMTPPVPPGSEPATRMRSRGGGTV